MQRCEVESTVRRRRALGVATLFVVDDPYEMNALLRALFAAKFHAPDDGPELAGSPILARLCERAMDGFTAAQEAGRLPGSVAQTRAVWALPPRAEVVASVRCHLAVVAASRGNLGPLVADGAVRVRPAGVPAVCGRGVVGAGAGWQRPRRRTALVDSGLEAIVPRAGLGGTRTVTVRRHWNRRPLHLVPRVRLWLRDHITFSQRTSIRPTSGASRAF